MWRFAALVASALFVPKCTSLLTRSLPAAHCRHVARGSANSGDESIGSSRRRIFEGLIVGGGLLTASAASAGAASSAARSATSAASTARLDPPGPPEWTSALVGDSRLNFPVYAVTTPQGAPLVAVDLDQKGRVRTVAYFFIAEDEAEEARKDVKKACPGVASRSVVTAVPFNDALALTFVTPYKIKGLPGYYCFRFHRSLRALSDALEVSGLESLSDLAVPAFVATPEVDGVIPKPPEIFLRLEDLEASRKSQPKGQRGPVTATDLGLIAKQWALARECNGGGGEDCGGSTISLVAEDAEVIPPPKKGKSEPPRNYLTEERILALEWDI